MAVRLRPRWLTATVIGLALAASTGCAGSAAKTPTVASVHSDPTVELHVGDTGPLTLVLHEVSPDGAEVPPGSVLLVVNDGQSDHRIQAGSTFDTGTLRPGDETTIVLVNEGPLTLVDRTTDRHVDLTVRASGCCQA